MFEGDKARTENEARRVAEQQSAVARLGLAALSGMALATLMDRAVQDVAQTLEAPYTKILQWLPEEEAFLAAAGVGWREGVVGRATVEAGARSLAGYTLLQEKPVIVDDMAKERRFRVAWLLAEHEVVCGMSVVIHGRERPFGALGAFCRERRQFSQRDADFLQAMANVVGTAIERQQTEDALRGSQQRLAVAMQASGAGVYEHAVPLGKEHYYSSRWAQILGYEQEELPAGEALLGWLLEQVHPEDAARQALAFGDFVAGRAASYEIEVRLRHKSGRWLWVRSFAQALERNEMGYVQRLAGMMFDIQAQKEAQEERERLLEALQALTGSLEERVAQRTKELRRRTEQLHATASSLTVAEQRERERISRILHDDLQQLLYAAQMQATMLQSEAMETGNRPLQGYLRELERLHHEAVAVTRSLTAELSPPVLEGEGLAEALAWLCNHMRSSYGLAVRLEAQKGAEPGGSDLRELVFQMVRELLFNVVKHAGVNAATVRVWTKDGCCLIEVRDEGRGFDEAALQEKEVGDIGYGLRSMRERLALFDGTFEMATAPGKGTRVVIGAPGGRKWGVDGGWR